MSEINLPNNAKLIYNRQQIDAAINGLAHQLNQQLKNENPVVLCVMQGGLVFSGNLIPKLSCMLEIDYIHATRYNNETSGSHLSWKAYPSTPLNNRVVLILDDILDEGKTLQAIIEYCQQQGVKKIVSAVLLKKLHNRCVDNQTDHPAEHQPLTENIALTVEDNYVFGFGMDYNGQYRQLNSIYALTDKE